MTSSTTLTRLQSAPTNTHLLRLLKDLKNAVIGNTWKKVEVVEDGELLQFLLRLLVLPRAYSGAKDGNEEVEVVVETAVIVGALANVGSLTIWPLLAEHTPLRIISMIRELLRHPVDTQANRLLPPILRALRNLIITTANSLWGHMWGVGAERTVVGTGLEGQEVLMRSGAPKGKGVAGKGKGSRNEASRALALLFEPENLDTLLSLLKFTSDVHTLLPLYQLLSRLVALPSHREALSRWRPLANSPRLRPGDRISGHASPSATSCPYVLDHLLATIFVSSSIARKPNSKLLEAVLDLLAALVKGQPGLAAVAKGWTPARSRVPILLHENTVLGPEAMFEERGGSPHSKVVELLIDLLVSAPTSVRIAAAGCLANITKAETTARRVDRLLTDVVSLQILDVIAKLVRSEPLEDRVRLCFILAALASDDATLQRRAADQDCPLVLLELMTTILGGEQAGELSIDLAARAQEAVLLGLAALSFQHEATRSLIAESTPPFLPYLLKALSHPSYGVRAAACQLTRALSRTVAILRTSLVDSGVGQEVVETLKREVDRQKRRAGLSSEPPLEDEEDFLTGEDELGERAWTVEVAATGTICNLIADFSPLKSTLLSLGGLELLCELTHSSYEPLALNALWALKNLTFHALEGMKAHIMSALGWRTLRDFIEPVTVPTLRAQALEITQNLLADASPTEMARTLDCLGEAELLGELQSLVKEGTDIELRVPALYILSNLALGNEKTRQSLLSRVEILEALSEGITARWDTVKVPALRCLRHLIESNAKTRRPRQAVMDLFQPYQLKSRLKELSEQSPSLDVTQAAVGLLEVLERGRESGSVGSMGTR